MKVVTSLPQEVPLLEHIFDALQNVTHKGKFQPFTILPNNRSEERNLFNYWQFHLWLTKTLLCIELYSLQENIAMARDLSRSTILKITKQKQHTKNKRVKLILNGVHLMNPFQLLFPPLTFLRCVLNYRIINFWWYLIVSLISVLMKEKVNILQLIIMELVG